MAFTLTPREIEGVSILDLSGCLFLGEACLELRAAMRGVINQHGRKILINLSEIQTIDSAGLGELVTAFTAARSHSANLGFFGFTPRVYNLLRITRLVTIFDMYDDEASALQSFRKLRS